MSLLAVDPGTEQSGWVILDRLTNAVLSAGVWDNADVLGMIRVAPGISQIAIEMIASYGMPVGAEVFETCVWIGRFIQAYSMPDQVDLVYRRTVKLHLCGNVQAKDANVRQALLDLYPGTGGGKTPQIGTKSQPGPLFGVKSHAWSALAVAITARATRAGAL